MKATFLSAILALTPVAVHATEIRPSPELVARALHQQEKQEPNIRHNPEDYEYHFRKIGERILFCAYYVGGNGGYCDKMGPNYVTKTDRAAIQFCKEYPNGEPPHAIYGEAGDLYYTCKGSRMTRSPYSFAFDEEGYVRRQWQLLD